MIEVVSLASQEVAAEDVASRFWSKVGRRRDDECWPWLAGVDRHGYGRFHVSGRHRAGAHRISYELLVGPIPEGLVLDHLCQNPLCVNPAHLEPVTHRENTLRGAGPTAENAKQTHCKNGHEFTPENTGRDRRPKRRCLACQRAWKRAAA